MIHGPCGTLNLNSPCMRDRSCSKRYPKQFNNTTVLSDEGYPVYRKRDKGATVDKNNVSIDNRFVVPYNPTLLLKYQAHINVEWCNQSRAIKYLFKYINKGNDRVTAGLVRKRNENADDNTIDEIKEYYDCRYVSACEAIWRIFAFEIHYRLPSVERLNFHLPGEQTVVFNENETIENVLNKPLVDKSMFLA